MLLPSLLALAAAATTASPPAPTAPAVLQDEAARIARSGPAAELDLARHLVRSSRPEEALTHLDAVLGEAPGPELAGLGRERARVAAFLELRETFLTGLAAEGGRLRVPVDGKHRNLRLEGYADGVITFAKNKYEVAELAVGDLDLADLAKAMGTAKVEPLEVRAHVLALVGDRRWDEVWGRDAEGPAELLADLTGAADSVERGARVAALRELEAFLGRRLSTADGDRVVELVTGVFPEGGVALDDDPGRHRFRTLRDLVIAGLEASFAPRHLPEILHAAEAEMRDGELVLRYDFSKAEQLEDWLRDDTYLGQAGQIGLLKTPEDEHRVGLVDDSLEFLGTRGLRFVLPYHGPLRLRYAMQLPEVGEDGLLWQMLVHVHDDLDKNRFVVHNLGYWIELLDLNFPSEVEREAQYYEIGADYWVELTVDRGSDLTARREDLTEEFLLTMPSRRVNRGYVRLTSHTDYPTRFTAIELQGTPDMARLDLFRGAWVDERLEALGF